MTTQDKEVEWEKEFKKLILLMGDYVFNGEDEVWQEFIDEKKLIDFIRSLLATRERDVLEKLRKTVAGDDDAMDTLEEIIQESNLTH